MLTKYARGMVFWANVPNYADSHIQDGKRPVVIISNDMANLFSPNVTIVPCTTNTAKNQPTHVHTELIDKRFSVILCETILTIDKKYLEEYVGVVDTMTMSKVNNALKVALGIGESNG